MNTEYQRMPFLRLIRERLGRNGKGGYQKKNLEDNKEMFTLIVLLREKKGNTKHQKVACELLSYPLSSVVCFC